ncbi:MAG: hypothetical protein H6832_03580 [Planctomycetes bacterium]|nr:hypothetical protein [Planctomycetota bacterium]
MNATAEIRIKIGEVEVSCPPDVEPERLEAVLRSIGAAFPRALAPTVQKRDTSLEDLLAASSAKTYGDKAGVIAYWLEEHQGRPDWRTGDVLDAFEQAGESPPANLTDALNQKAKKGLFEVQDRRWKLTGEGRGWVKYSLLPRDAD